MNWKIYNKSLNNRGDLTIWFTKEGVDHWLEDESGARCQGRLNQYSDIAMKTMYTLRQVFNLRLRQMAGFTRSILKIMKLNLPIPDYTTVSRRARNLLVDFVTQKPEGKINFILKHIFSNT